MSQPKHFKSSDLRNAMRLLGECRELGDGPVVWRRHFCQALGKLLSAELVISVEVVGCLRGPIRVPGGTAWGASEELQWRGLANWCASCDETPPRLEAWQALQKLAQLKPSRGATAARQALLTTAAWRATFDYLAVAQPLGVDAALFSLCPIDASRDHYDSLTIYRARGQRLFDTRETVGARLLHQEISRLIGGPLAAWEEPAPSQLPPRVRQVLRFLLEGDGDKQIAARLSISRHTVNQYTKQIYRLFGVQSRTELLARWVRRGWGVKADWKAPTTQTWAGGADLQVERCRAKPA